jgi:ABC-type multidrug transport system ATPase subunit
MEELAITATGLTKTFGAGTNDVVRAVDGIDLAVPTGKIFGFLGRNGQGKSTTVRMLCGLTQPTAGVAHVGGVNIDRRTEMQHNIGVTLQDVALDELQTGRQHLALVASLWGMRRGDARRRANEMLDEFGLGDAADRTIANYSGGMRRRLDLATSLINEPSILFLDEPTTGLDPQSRRALWVRIRKLTDDGSTVFLTTQYLEEADELSDELAIIDAGRILARGTPEQLRHTYGTTTIRARVIDPQTRSAMASAFGSGVVEVGEWLSIDQSNPATAAQLVAVATARAIPDELSVHTSTLEDVFLDLTGAGLTRDPAVPAVAVAS